MLEEEPFWLDTELRYKVSLSSSQTVEHSTISTNRPIILTLVYFLEFLKNRKIPCVRYPFLSYLATMTACYPPLSLTLGRLRLWFSDRPTKLPRFPFKSCNISSVRIIHISPRTFGRRARMFLSPSIYI